MKRKHKNTIIYTLLITLSLCIMLLSVSVYTYSKRPELAMENRVVEYFFVKKVEQYREQVETHAKDEGIAEHTNLLLAMMMQESGGKGNDPMQSSESLCGSVGCIDSPEVSIQQGVKYFSKALDEAEGNVYLAIQAYNFGLGFIDFVQTSQAPFSQDIVNQFSQKMYAETNVKEDYQCLRKEAQEIDACYGDIFYTRDVLAHKKKFEQ